MKLGPKRPWKWSDLIDFFADHRVMFWFLLVGTYLLGYCQGRYGA